MSVAEVDSNIVSVTVQGTGGGARYSSNANGAVYVSSCAGLASPRLILKASSPIIGNPNYASGTWGHQINCWSVKGSVCTFQQYVPFILSGHLYMAFGFFNGSDSPFGYPLLNVGPITDPLPAGWILDLQIFTDPTTRHVTGGTLTVLNASGSVLTSFSFTTAQLLPQLTGFDPSWFSPIAAFTAELLTDNGRTDNFASASGTLQYIPSAGQSYSAWSPATSVLFPGKTDYGPPSCVAVSTQHTAEQAPNVKYSAFRVQGDGSLLQDFFLG